MLNQILKLERPLAILDLETTGLLADRDRIIQIAITMHYANKDPVSWSSLINPGVPITNVGSHRITNERVASAPAFKEFASEFGTKLSNVDIGGHNVNFDIGFMRAEMSRAGVPWDWSGHVIDTLMICRLKIPHTLGNAYKRFVDPLGFPIDVNGLSSAHDAANDVAACEKVLFAQLKEFEDLPRTVEQLAEFCTNKNPNGIDRTGKFVWNGDVPCINFGKHKGKPMKDVDKGYFIWLINTDGFPDDAILLAGDALKGKFPIK